MIFFVKNFDISNKVYYIYIKLITVKKMENLITNEVKKVALKKAIHMPLEHYSRLMINGYISDIVIKPTCPGIYFYNSPEPISKDIESKIICFISYRYLD